MALAEVLHQRSDTERDLLHRLLAFQSPVPFEGIKALALPDLANPSVLMDALLDVSLLEQFNNPEYQTTDYQLSPLVRDWLQQHGGAGEPGTALLATAAEYQLWLLQNERNTLNQALATHAALNQAGLYEQAQGLVLDWIVEPLQNAGLYQTLLDDWLPPLAEANNSQIRGHAFTLIGQQHSHLTSYNIALDYYNQALAIQQQIGDRKMEGTTLNNLAHLRDYSLPKSLIFRCRWFLFRKSSFKSMVIFRFLS